MMKWIAAATAVCALAPMAVAGVPDYPHDLPPTPKAHLLATSLLVAYRYRIRSGSTWNTRVPK